MIPSLRRPIAAIAIFAILLNALAPTVARAWLPGGADVICTAQGPKSASPAGNTDERPHCPYCVPHAGSFGAPPPAAMPLPEPCAAHGFAAADQAGEARPVWPGAQPRAPPFPG